ncbi:hypothetical protein ACFO3U_05170 [Flavobacterium ponti]|uniref:Uncharacterized protein n=1 Tax=Flavobacterium ponti TaxID=665133 RepID=A0ABV9P194_9FLAO
MTEPIVFDVKGYPIMKVYDDYFEIKAIDYWEFRRFNFVDVKSVEILNPNQNWLYKLYVITSLIAQIFSKDEPNTLKINLKNYGDWKYTISNKRNLEFDRIIKLIRQRIIEK